MIEVTLLVVVTSHGTFVPSSITGNEQGCGCINARTVQESVPARFPANGTKVSAFVWTRDDGRY